MNILKSEIYSTLTNEQLELLKKIDKAVEEGKDVKTFYPSCLKRAKNGKWYEFITNIDIKRLRQTETVIENLKAYDYIKLSRYASDSSNNELPDCFSVWVPVNETPKSLIDDFFSLDRELSLRYKELLIKCGIPEEELHWTAQIYLGCEKDRWPDKPWITNRINDIINNQDLER